MKAAGKLKAKRVRKVKPGDLVYVQWYDAVEDGTGWEDVTKCELVPHYCLSVGFVIRADKKAIVLAGTIGAHDGVKESIQRLAIPLGWVEEVRRIRP
jgi:hypothetical protein